jgi:hypothetical protein
MAKTKTFSVKTQKDPDTLVSEAKQVAKENDATFQGDTSSGSFSGKGVEGNYEIEGQTVEVTITDKPTLAPWSKVESLILPENLAYPTVARQKLGMDKP